MAAGHRRGLPSGYTHTHTLSHCQGHLIKKRDLWRSQRKSHLLKANTASRPVLTRTELSGRRLRARLKAALWSAGEARGRHVASLLIRQAHTSARAFPTNYPQVSNRARAHAFPSVCTQPPEQCRVYARQRHSERASPGLIS